jgi:hypothetical protein
VNEHRGYGRGNEKRPEIDRITRIIDTGEDQLAWIEGQIDKYDHSRGAKALYHLERKRKFVVVALQVLRYHHLTSDPETDPAVMLGRVLDAVEGLVPDDDDETGALLMAARRLLRLLP